MVASLSIVRGQELEPDLETQVVCLQIFVILQMQVWDRSPFGHSTSVLTSELKALVASRAVTEIRQIYGRRVCQTWSNDSATNETDQGKIKKMHASDNEEDSIFKPNLLYGLSSLGQRTLITTKLFQIQWRF